MPKDIQVLDLIKHAVAKRFGIIETTALRLFNGFFEGLPGLVLDRYGSALVIFDYAEPETFKRLIEKITDWATADLEGLQAVLLKRRHQDRDGKQGIISSGNKLPDQITEFDVHYALNLQLQQDASFYLDTRYLRRWLLKHTTGQRVLNTFAYTGSLGIAAGMGGASSVTQTDLNQKYLDIAQQSWLLNDLPLNKHQLIAGDFFRVLGRMRNQKSIFDCVILDPPFFSTTDAGRVDLLGETTRLINKVRPLVAHEGWLVVINNALFLSGSDFMDELESLCKSQYVAFEDTIPVPQDVTGYPDTVVGLPPVDSTPFNHPTKIGILKVFRKDERQFY
jgi:23S rRNA (cytosine1962-C5)-methyltransferase